MLRVLREKGHTLLVHEPNTHGADVDADFLKLPSLVGSVVDRQSRIARKPVGEGVESDES